MMHESNAVTTDRPKDNPLGFEPYLPAVIQPSSKPGRIEELVARALRHR